MSWFTWNPIKYAQEEWNGESALGKYDPLHLFKEAGASFGLWKDNDHPADEKLPVVKFVEDSLTGWTYWFIWAGIIFIFLVFAIFLISRIL